MRIQQLTQYESVVKQYQKEVINFLYRLVGNRFEAEDLAQDTFIKAYKKFDSIKDSQKMRSWLLSIARNTAVDFFRSHKEKNVALDNTILENWVIDNAVQFEAQVINVELSKELQSCISLLQPDRAASKNNLYYHPQIQEIIEISKYIN